MAEAERERLHSNPELPEECMREIVLRLNPKEWCRGCAVSQKFHEACGRSLYNILYYYFFYLYATNTFEIVKIL